MTPSKNKVSKDYDDTSLNYDVTRSFFTNGYGGVREVQLTNPYVSGPLILDIAAGTGRALPYHATKGLNIALDISKGMMNVGKRKSPQSLFLQCDAEEFPFKDSSFDTMYCSRAIKYFSNLPKFLKETSRCLKDGGIIIIVAETSDTFWVRLATMLKLMDFFDVRFRSKDIVTMFEDAGFKLVCKKSIFYLPSGVYQHSPPALKRLIAFFDDRIDFGKGMMFAFRK